MHVATKNSTSLTGILSRTRPAVSSGVASFHAHTSRIFSPVFPLNGERIATGSVGRTVKAEEAGPRHPEGVEAITFVPDGKRVFSGGMTGTSD